MRYYAILVLLAAFAPTLPAWATVDSISACGTSVAKSEAVTVFTGGDSITIKGFLVDTLDRLEITGVTGSATLLGKSSGSIRVGINTARDQDGKFGTLHIRYLVEVAGHDVVYFVPRVRPRIDQISIAPLRKPSLPQDRLVVGQVYEVKAHGDHPIVILAPPKPIDSGGNTITPDKAGTLRLTAQDFLIELTNCNLRAEGIGVLETAVVDGDVEPYLDTSTLFRTGANGSCGGQRLPTLDASICSRANEPTSADSTVTTDVALAGVTWGVLNRLDAPLAKSFRIQLKKGATVLATETVNGLAAKAQKTFVYRRPENRRRALKVRNCPACLDTLFYNWIEPTYTVEVDADKTLKEGNAGEANNRKDYLP